MELNQSFESHGWTIKYNIAEAGSPDNRQICTVVFVHGTPWSSDVFQPVAKALLARGTYRVLLYDLPGYGTSQTRTQSSDKTSSTSPFEGNTSVATQATVLADLLHHLNLDGKDGNEAPAIIAHDIAGTIALRTHLIHGCRFSSLLLLDTNTVLPWGDGFYKLVRSKPDAFLELPPSIFEAMTRAVIRSACFNPRVLESGWEDALARPWVGSAEEQRSFVRQIAQANDADVAEMLEGDMYANVGCDVKIIWGEQDQWIPREKMDSLAQKLGDRLKEFVIVPEAGHLCMLDQPERVSVELFDWLEKQR